MEFTRVGNRYSIKISPNEVAPSTDNTNSAKIITNPINVRGYGKIIGPILDFFGYAKKIHNEKTNKDYYFNARSFGKAALIRIGMDNFAESKAIKDIAARLIFSSDNGKEPNIPNNIINLRWKLWHDPEFMALGSLTEEAIEALEAPTTITTIKTDALARPQADEYRDSLIHRGFIECRKGVLPPFTLRSLKISMKPPTMNLEDAPIYRYIPHPLAAPAYDIDSNIKKLPPKEQIAWFMNRIREIDPKLEEEFLTAKKQYTSMLEQLEENPPQSNDDLERLRAFVMKFDTLPSRLGFLSQIDTYAAVVNQLAEIHKEKYDATAELAEMDKIASNSRQRYLSALEVSTYLRSYLKWQESELKRGAAKTLASPLDQNKEYFTCKATDNNRYTRQFAEMSIDKNSWLTTWPRDYNSVTISRLNSTNQWECLPVLIKTNDQDDRYQLKFKTEPNKKYRIDVGIANRINDKGLVSTELGSIETFFIQT